MADPRPVQQSVFDRLTGSVNFYDSEAERHRPPRDGPESVEVLKANILRDLRELFRTTKTEDVSEDEYPFILRSVYCYGLPDLSGLEGTSQRDLGDLKRSLEDAIAWFEPRLEDVEVIPAGWTGPERRPQFKLKARVRTEPEKEDVEFDTFLDAVSHKLEIKDSGPDE